MENKQLNLMRFLKKKKVPLYKQKETFYNLVVEVTEEIRKLHDSVSFQNFIYHFLRVPLNI